MLKNPRPNFVGSPNIEPQSSEIIKTQLFSGIFNGMQIMQYRRYDKKLSKNFPLLYCSNELFCAGMAEWLMHQTSNLRIASRMGSIPVRGKSLFI